MADQHIGYPGSVGATQLANWLPNVAASQYSVDGPLDAKVTTNAIGDRGVTIAPGTVIGDGIYDVFESGTNLNFGSVASGSRWDMVVLRRTWSSTIGASTSIYTIIPGSATKGLPARNNNKGVLSDQPIALCRVQSGSTAVQEVVDLRVWAHNGGVFALDDLVKSYLDQPGTHLTIGTKSWVRTVTVSGSSNDAAWVETSGTEGVTLYGRGSQAPYNSSTGTNPSFLMQAGFEFVTTDANAFGVLYYPKPFPNGVLSIHLQNGDNFIFNDMGIAPAGAAWGTQAINKASCAFRIYGKHSNGVRDHIWPNQKILVSYLVIGY